MSIHMEYSCAQFNDLPDEIIMIILKKLWNVEVLCTFIDVNDRLTRIAHDSSFTKHLTLMRRISDESICRLPESTLDQFCSKILPDIYYKIKWLNLESSTMERILLAGTYPNLYGLGLYNVDTEKALSLFNGKKFKFFH
jgi:hypothetical protein